MQLSKPELVVTTMGDCLGRGTVQEELSGKYEAHRECKRLRSMAAGEGAR